MARIKDEVTLWVRRGTPKNKEAHLAGLWFQYRMKDIAMRYHHITDDISINPPAWNDQGWRVKKEIIDFYEGGNIDEAGPTQYCFRGTCKPLGSETLWKALISDVCEALEKVSNFMDGGSVSTKYSTKARAPWFMWDQTFGCMANASKPLQVQVVGKSCRLGNGKEPAPLLPGSTMDKGCMLTDTQLKNVWAVGEACAVGKLASASRAAFKENHHQLRNDRILEKLGKKMDRNAVLVLECIPYDENDVQWAVLHQQPWQLTDKDIGHRIEHYGKRMAVWSEGDPFQHVVSTRNSLEPVALIHMLQDRFGTKGTYTVANVTEVLHNT